MRSAFALVLIVLAGPGCTMCDNPHDYTSPVISGGYTGGYATEYNEDAVGPMMDGEMVPDEAPMPPEPRPAVRPSVNSTSFRGR